MDIILKLSHIHAVTDCDTPSNQNLNDVEKIKVFKNV